MIGPILGASINAAGMLLGSIIGIARPGGFSPQSESFLKFCIALFTVFHGLRLLWMSFSGTFGEIMKQVLMALLAVVLGRLLGRLLCLQKLSNRAGQYARKLIETTTPAGPERFSNGLASCAILFCASPLGMIGAILAVLPAGAGGGGNLYPLAIKAVMDGLAMTGFVRMFGWGAVVSTLPVFVFLSVISLGCTVYVEPLLRAHGLTDSVNIAGGMLLTVMSLVMFEIKRVELADYLPSLAVAPVLFWLLK